MSQRLQIAREVGALVLLAVLGSVMAALVTLLIAAALT